jgi:hypothetical protein
MSDDIEVASITELEWLATLSGLMAEWLSPEDEDAYTDL